MVLKSMVRFEGFDGVYVLQSSERGQRPCRYIHAYNQQDKAFGIERVVVTGPV